MIVDTLNQFGPEPDILLHSISTHISDEMLECISTADYGCRADEHLSALRQVRDTGAFPEKMHWCPMEVFELIRWSEPDDPNWKPGRPGEFGHWMRAFSCAAILRAEHAPWNYHHNDSSSDSTVIQLILSLQALPVDLNCQAAQHLAWLILNSDPEGMNESVREYGVALFWFSLHLDSHVSDDHLIALAQWTIKRADELNWHPQLAEFAGLKAMVIGCQKRSAWEIFGLQLSEFELTGRSADLKTWSRLLAEQLID